MREKSEEKRGRIKKKRTGFFCLWEFLSPRSPCPHSLPLIWMPLNLLTTGTHKATQISTQIVTFPPPLQPVRHGKALADAHLVAQKGSHHQAQLFPALPLVLGLMRHKPHEGFQLAGGQFGEPGADQLANLVGGFWGGEEETREDKRERERERIACACVSVCVCVFCE